MKKLFIIIMFLFFAVPCWGADYYIAQSAEGTGLGTSCVNADALADLTWGAGNMVAAGDTLHLCGDLTSTLIIGASGTLGNPITIKLENGAKFSKTLWGADHNAAIDVPTRDYIVIDGGTNGIIENTDNGTGLGTQSNTTGVYITRSNYVEVKNLTIRNLYVRAYGDAATGAGTAIKTFVSSNSNIHNNTISYVFYGIIAGGGSVTVGDDVINTSVYNNDISSVATGIVGQSCNSSYMYVYGNYIHDFGAYGGTWNGGANWNHRDGIHFYGASTVGQHGPHYIYNNKIGGDFVDGTTTAFIFFEHYATPVYIYNNITYSTTSFDPANGHIALGTAWTVGEQPAYVYIYNNTMASNAKLASGQYGIYLANAGTDNNFYADIKNNIFLNVRSGIVDVHAADTGKHTVITSDNNDFYNYDYIGGADANYSTIVDWRTYLGGCPGINKECNSITTDPLLTAAYKPTIQTLGADVSSVFTADYNGDTRICWNMGAVRSCFNQTLGVGAGQILGVGAGQSLY